MKIRRQYDAYIDDDTGNWVEPTEVLRRANAFDELLKTVELAAEFGGELDLIHYQSVFAKYAEQSPKPEWVCATCGRGVSEPCTNENKDDDA